MNERIPKFAEQCGFRSNPDLYDRNQSFDIPKFAELIIQECIKCIQLTTARDPRDTVQYKQSVGHIHRIRDHFGVE